MTLRIINIKGPAGRIEAKYYTHGNKSNNPVVLILHPVFSFKINDNIGMNDKVIIALYQAFAKNGFNVLRINFRGFGNSEGNFDNGAGELQDALSVFDWLQIDNPGSNNYWIAGFSFGSWIAMELLMRRPEITNFIAVAPPVNKYEFSFLNPCPVPGLVVQGNEDDIVDYNAVISLMQNNTKARLNNTKLHIVQNGNHYFENCLRNVYEVCSAYITQSVEKYNADQSHIISRKRKKKIDALQ